MKLRSSKVPADSKEWEICTTASCRMRNCTCRNQNVNPKVNNFESAYLSVFLRHIRRHGCACLSYPKETISNYLLNGDVLSSEATIMKVDVTMVSMTNLTWSSSVNGAMFHTRGLAFSSILDIPLTDHMSYVTKTGELTSLAQEFRVPASYSVDRTGSVYINWQPVDERRRVHILAPQKSDAWIIFRKLLMCDAEQAGEKWVDKLPEVILPIICSYLYPQPKTSAHAKLFPWLNVATLRKHEGNLKHISERQRHQLRLKSEEATRRFEPVATLTLNPAPRRRRKRKSPENQTDQSPMWQETTYQGVVCLVDPALTGEDDASDEGDE